MDDAAIVDDVEKRAVADRRRDIGARSKRQATCVAVTSPRPPPLIASSGLTRVGAITRPPATTGDAIMR